MNDQVLVPRLGSYEEICRAFRWPRLPRANLAWQTVERRAADADRLALICEDADGRVRRYGFREIDRLASRFANLLTTMALPRGSRIALLLGQQVEAPVAHVGSWKAAMVSLPLSRLFGEQALLQRLADSGAAVLVTDGDGWSRVEPLLDRLPDLRCVLVADHDDPELGLWPRLERARDRFEALEVAAEEPAYINYTSGTTGPPKGVVKGHGALLGLMPAVEFAQDFFPQPNDLAWSPADWSWMAGMTNVLFASWFHGVPVLAMRSRRGFDAEEALAGMERHGVRNVLLTPTMLKLLRQLPAAAFAGGPRLRSLYSGSEAVGPELMDWARRTLGTGINVVFGQTECNMVLVNNHRVMAAPPGSLGRPCPGHRVSIVDEEGRELPPEAEGQIAVRRPHPLMMLEYWRAPEATAAKFAGDWMLTGDLGRVDGEGYFWFHGRADDVISSAGYRIGPGEVEESLLSHPAVALAAVIGVPDPERYQAVKAYVVPAAGVRADAALAEALQQHVKRHLARHEYPREIAFVDNLPLTTTGKIMRAELRRRDALERGKQEATCP